MVRKTMVYLLVLYVVNSINLYCQENLLMFYPRVDSLILFPAQKESLDMVCERKIDGLNITLMKLKGYEKVWIAVVTQKRVRDIKKKITLSVGFNGVRPSAGEVTTWGYVFDRNGDGKIDYMALLGGAAPVKKSDFPPDFPYRGKPLSRAHLELIVSHSSLVFNHWADDNFDDTLDAVIHVDMDPLRDWVQRHIVIRSTKFSNRFDDAWGFQENIGGERDSLDVIEQHVRYMPIGKTQEEELTWKNFQEKTAVLQLINRAFAACKLKPN